MKNRIRAIIVDDERLARNKLRSMLAGDARIEVVGEADSVASAAEAIKDLAPDLVFLDIQMPGETGFDLLDRVDREFETIFVTAFDEHAIRAFEVNALDYLLKPVNPERLARSIERLSAPQKAPENAARALDYDDHLLLTIEGRSRFVKVSAIEYICAAGPYSELYTSDGRKALMLKSLKEWEERLPEKHFMRIHRSTIINIERVDHIESWFNYSYRVYLYAVKEPFIMSRRYAAKMKERMR